VDVILQLIEKAGDFVSDDIWYRVVQFVTNNEDLQVFVVQAAERHCRFSKIISLLFFYYADFVYSLRLNLCFALSYDKYQASVEGTVNLKGVR